MGDFALSSGCFIGHEAEFERGGIAHIELASHPMASLARIVSAVRRHSIAVTSVHAPCPRGRIGINLAATADDDWAASARAIRDAMEIAEGVGARYVVVHSFYCVTHKLPSDDIARATALQAHGTTGQSLADYIMSDPYHEARNTATRNLQTLVPDLKRTYPMQRLVLENLNPRIGYGGIVLDDVLTVAEALDGEVGICLDIGHLTLATKALGTTLDASVTRAKDLIWATHIHQNFGGEYCIDRYWSESSARAGLQEVDVHLPLTSRYTALPLVPPAVTADNSAFQHLLRGTVQHTANTHDVFVEGSVRATELLGLLNASTLRVFEYDSRYAPLAEILSEYGRTLDGSHPLQASVH